jgi:hypothetical protein
VKIQVALGSRSYTYWIEGDVKVGDAVMVPPPFWDPRGDPQRVQVAVVGSDYDGPLITAWLPHNPGQDG